MGKRQRIRVFFPGRISVCTLTCVKNNREIDVAGFVKRVREEHGFQIDGGYGKIKGRTFRISNMGDESVETMYPLLEALTASLRSL